MTFDYTGYKLKFIQKQTCQDESGHLFTLIYKFYSPKTKYHYVIRAEYHEQDVFAVKFYCKKDKRSSNKYSKIVNRGDIGNILITCAKVVPLLLEEYPTACFAFAGARSIDPIFKKVEPFTNTQRFLIYKKIAAIKFGPKTFAHIPYETISSYLLVNRYYKDINKKEKELKEMFAKTYENLIEIG